MNEIELMYQIRTKKITSNKVLFNMYPNVSEATLRRKLIKLVQAGYITTSYGGIITIIPEDKLSIDDQYKKSIESREKVKLCMRVSHIVSDGEIIFIENGTTVSHLIKLFSKKDILIYTNGIYNIDLLEKYNCKYKIVCGDILHKEGSIVGEEAINFISTIFFDKAFIGANGIDPTCGVTTPNIKEANFKKAVLNTSQESYIIIDKTKFNKKFKHKVCNLNEHIIIT